MEKRLLISFKSSLFLLLALLLVSCGKEEPQKKAPAPEVNVVLVKKSNITNHVEFVGQVYGYQDLEIRARVDGFLEGIHFNEGFRVKKGQLLYTIDSQPYRAEVSSFQSKVAEAKTAYAKAESDLNRYKPLAKSNAVSQADLDNAQAQYDAAISSVEAAEANLEISKIKLSYTKIKSPIDGIIGKTQSYIGEYVGNSMGTIVLNTVSQIDEIRVDFFLPENNYLQVMKTIEDANAIFNDDNFEKKENLELILGDGSKHKYKGSVNFIDRGIDPSTGTLLVQTSFKNPEKIVRPGQYAKVRIPVIAESVIIIPQKCVMELQGQYSVFVVNNENKVESRQIVTGNKSGDLLIIDKGLNTGEKIIIDGLQKVRNGIEVIPTEIEFQSKTTSN